MDIETFSAHTAERRGHFGMEPPGKGTPEDIVSIMQR